MDLSESSHSIPSMILACAAAILSVPLWGSYPVISQPGQRCPESIRANRCGSGASLHALVIVVLHPGTRERTAGPEVPGSPSSHATDTTAA